MMTSERSFQSLIGESKAFSEVLEQTSKLASIDQPIVIIGERGTGKEMIAERLHFLSDRWEAELIKVNCAAIQENLLESELFGHEAGAFTGATKSKVGLLEAANGGTLFLDEIQSASARFQQRLLRVAEYGEFQRVGSTATKRVDLRLVAASNQNLWKLADEGRFRHDLLDRLGFDYVKLPSLKERGGDILLLAEHFALQMTSRLDREFFHGFTNSAKEELLTYSWPGNVRELKNTIQRSVFYWGDHEKPISRIRFNTMRPSKSQQHAEGAKKTTSVLMEKSFDLRQHISNTEKLIIEDCLKHFSFKQTLAAKHLGLSYHQLRASMKKYKIEARAKGFNDDCTTQKTSLQPNWTGDSGIH